MAGVLEAAGIARARHAVFVVAVDAQRGAARIGHRDHAAELLLYKPAAIAGAGAFIPDDRLVHAGAMYVAALHDVRAIVLRDGVEAVVQEARGHAAAHGLVQPPRRIVRQRRRARAGEPVEHVVTASKD